MKTALLSLIAAVSIASFVMAGQPEPTANWAQSEFAEGWTCVGPDTANVFSDWYDVQGSGLALTTAGGPLLVSLVVNMDERANVQVYGAGFQTRVLIDDQPQDVLLLRGLSITAPQVGLLSGTKVYPVAAGLHRLRVQVSCQPSWVLLNGWLNVYELPLVRR